MEDTVEKLSKQIAERLLKIKQTESERIVLENKLEQTLVEVDTIKQTINNCDNTIRACKYQINEKLSSLCNGKISLVSDE